MADKEHTTLYTIFNRNDPSPTATALRNHDYDSAVVPFWEKWNSTKNTDKFNSLQDLDFRFSQESWPG